MYLFFRKIIGDAYELAMDCVKRIEEIKKRIDDQTESENNRMIHESNSSMNAKGNYGLMIKTRSSTLFSQSKTTTTTNVFIDKLNSVISGHKTIEYNCPIFATLFHKNPNVMRTIFRTHELKISSQVRKPKRNVDTCTVPAAKSHTLYAGSDKQTPFMVRYDDGDGNYTYGIC